MNQFKTHLYTLWSRIANTIHGESYVKIGLRPSKDWLRILGFFSIGFVVSAAIALYIYIDVVNGAFVPTLPAQTVSHTPMLDQNMLQAVNTYFAQETQNTTSLESTTSIPADPSR